MTDKELKKLSRLELLELLLEARKENERLKAKIEQMKIDYETAHSIEKLNVTTRQVGTALEYANNLTNVLRQTTQEVVSAKNSSKTKTHVEEENNTVNQNPISDRDIYWRIMGFFSKNNEVLDMLPYDLKNDISVRIKEIVERIKKKYPLTGASADGEKEIEKEPVVSKCKTD